MKFSKKLLSLLLCAVMVLGSVVVGGKGFAEMLDVFFVKASATLTPQVNISTRINRNVYPCAYYVDFTWSQYYSVTKYYLRYGVAEYDSGITIAVVDGTYYTMPLSSYKGPAAENINGVWYTYSYYVKPYNLSLDCEYPSGYAGTTALGLSPGGLDRHGVKYYDGSELFYYNWSEDSFNCGSPYTIISSQPSKTGHTFLGWSTNSNANSPQYVSGETLTALHGSEQIINLYAVWKLNTYTISYNANGGSGAPAPQTKYYGSSLTLRYNEPTRDGYIFLGWSKSSSATSPTYYPGDSFSGNYSTTLYAIWQKKAPKTYTITYSANGGSGAPTSQTKTEGVALTLSSTKPSRNGYTFLGWAETSAATVAAYQPCGSFTKDANTTLYAAWSKNAATYTVKYDANGGSGAPASQTKIEDTTLALSSTKPTRTGYTFKNWNTKADGTGTSYSVGASYTANAAVTLYAQWTANTYTVTYNANGGSGAPANQTKTYGKTLTLSSTKPTREEYTFLGWAETSTATAAVYQPGGSFTKDANTTLYAVWQKQSSSFSKSNRYAFSNARSNFVTSWSSGKYYLTEDDSDKLFGYIKKYSNNPNTTISSVQSFMNSTWGGSCYGMASTSILDYTNQIAFNENFGNGAQTMYAVKSPSLDKNLMSAINYYMVSQRIDFIRNSSVSYEKGAANWSAGLKKLVSTIQKGDPILFCYYYSRGGHAIVAYDCITNADGSISIIAYDNRFPNQDTIIAIDKDYKSCVVNGNENALAIQFYTDLSSFDKIDIDGPNNDMNIKYNSYSHETTGSTEIQFLAKGDVTITNDAGQTLTFKDGTFGGNMPITSKRFIVCETANGDGNEVEFIVNVADSDSFTLESTADDKSFAVTSSTMYAAASATNADAIVIGEGEGVYVIGSNMAYSTSLVSKDNSYDTVIVEGNSENDVSLTYAGNNILVSGVTGSSEKLTVYTHNTEYTDYTVESGYSDVAITSGAGGVDVKGSSSGNSNYDVSVVKTSESSSNSQYVEINNYIDSIKVDYRSKLTFRFNASNIPEGSTVHWYVNGVDKGTGSAYVENTASKDFNIQARMVSNEGTVLAESKVETVTVNTGFFAKLIAFFRGLFNSLPVYVDNKKV